MPRRLFLHVAVDSWHALQSSAQDGRVRVDAFVDGMKSKFGSTWNDKLVEPAKNLYATVIKDFSDVVKQQPDKGKIASIFDNVKHKLGETWEQKVKSNLKLADSAETVKTAISHRVVEPAEAFYRYAAEGYHNLAASGPQSVTFSDFLGSLRGRLGSAWNSQLLEPARYIFEKFRGDPRTLQDDGEKNEEEGDAPPNNTASPMPTSLRSDSPQGSGSNSPAPEQHVLYPADVEDEEDHPQPNGHKLDDVNHEHDDVYENPPQVVIANAPAKKGSSKSTGKKKKNGKKKSGVGAE